jgi:transposase
MSENTCTLTDADEAVAAPMWIKISTLVSRKVVWLPLAGNPYVEKADDVSKGVHARKDKRGRWRFEVVEKKEWVVPEPKEDAPRIGVDVGLNVVAATSDGRTFGADLKPKFDRLYERVKNLRANRQRQGLKGNSPRLDRLEDKLTGMVKTITGEIANKMRPKIRCS